MDGIIFVVDSQRECLNHNLRSWNELKTLFGNELHKIPIVISLNKHDLAQTNKLNENDFISHIDYTKFKQMSLKKTAAIKGDGILDSFSQLIKFIFPQLIINLEINN